jgi:hypothetical protein
LLQTSFKTLAKVMSDSVLNSLHTFIEDVLYTKIDKGVVMAKGEGLRLVKRWVDDLHWQTVKATCRRDGEFREMDWNMSLSEPVYRPLSANWQQFFSIELPEKLSSIVGSMEQLTEQCITQLVASLEGWKSTIFRICTLSDSLKQRCKQMCTTEFAKFDSQMRERQRAMSRTIAPLIKEKMMETYQNSYEEVGKGSAARRSAILVQGMKATKDSMYEESVLPLKEALQHLERDLQEMLFHLIDRLKTELSNIVLPLDTESLFPQEAQDELAALVAELRPKVDAAHSLHGRRCGYAFIDLPQGAGAASESHSAEASAGASIDVVMRSACEDIKMEYCSDAYAPAK